MSVSPFNEIGHSYLLSRPYVYNGGLIAQVLSNLAATDSSTNLSLILSSNLSITNYITQFFFSFTSKQPYFINSSVTYTDVPLNNLPTSIFGLLFVAVVFLSGFVASILWVCWRMVYCYPFSRICPKQHRSPDLTFLSHSGVKEKRHKFLNYAIALCIISFCLLISFIISYTFSVIAQINLQQQLVNSDTNTSFMSSWKQSSNQLNAFINHMIYDSFNIFNQTIGNMSQALNNALFGSLSDLTSDLLLAFGVVSLFNNSNILITNLQTTINSMQYISQNTEPTLSQINFQSGLIGGSVALLKLNMQRVCTSVSTNTSCLAFLNQSNLLLVPINTNQISSSSSVTMLFMLGQFQLNITSLSIQFATMQTDFNNQLIAQTNAQIQALNLYQTVSTLTQVWPFISTTTYPWIQNFNSLSTSISSFLTIYGLTIFITTSVLIGVLIILAILYTIALVKYSLIFSLKRQSANFLPPSFYFDFDSYRNRHVIEKIKRVIKISHPIIYGYFIFTSAITVLILILSVTIINASHLFYNEACVQIWRPQGLIVTDTFLDMFINNYWSSILSFIKAQNLPLQFTFPQPTRIMSGIMNKCQNDNGIFYALNMSNFVNISSFLWSPQNYQSLVGGLNITYSALLSTNVMAAFPQTMTSFLNSSASISAYFDQVNYQPSIDELSKGVVSLPNYAAWIDSAIQYFSSILSNDAEKVVSQLNDLKNNIPNLTNLASMVTNLRNSFQILQNSRTNSLNIQTLLSNIQNVQNLFVDSPATYQQVQSFYNRRMMVEFPVKALGALNSLLGYLIDHLFPCSYLSNAISILLNNLCSSDCTIEKMASYGLNVSVTCACLIALLHLLWRIIRIEIKEKNQKTTSVC